MPSQVEDPVPLLTQLAMAGESVGFRSGTVTAWNAETGENTVNIAGADIEDLPILVQSEKLAIQIGDVVALLAVKNQFFILGRLLTDEGEIVVRSATGQVQFRIGRAPNGGGELATYHPNGETHTYMGHLYLIATGEPLGQGFLIQDDAGTDLFTVRSLEVGGLQLVRAHAPTGVLALSTKTAGGVSLYDANGTEVVNTRVDGGVTLFDGLGNTAVTGRPTGGSAMFDTNGQQIVRNDQGAEGLLDRPFMDVPMYPLSSAAVDGVTGAGFIELWYGRLWITHPYLHIQVLVNCIGAGTTGELHFDVDGTSITGNVAFSNTTPTYLDFGGPIKLAAPLLAAPYSFVMVRIRGRRQGAAGTVTIRPYGVTKRGTP